ncbi:MAG: hypothetical protein JSS86_07610 [Cyanobacteria bacterium SZAS LIN-2]|nr:hypothetical protein [Cyanobacteria bacterium SZAS LIN-2]
MIKSNQIKLSLLLALTLTVAQSQIAACAQTAADSPKPELILRPIGDTGELFEDPYSPNMDFHQSLISPNITDEGLKLSAQIREYVQDRPSSRRIRAVFEEGWMLPLVVKHTDDYGLFDLIPLAEQKAIRLADFPLEQLKEDGVQGLVITAHYYDKTGRQEISNRIYENLRKHIWPDYRWKELSEIVAYGYYEHLKSLGDKNGSKAALKAYFEMEGIPVNPYQKPGFFYEPDWGQSPLDWKPAYEAYKALQAQHLPEAAAEIDRLVAEENKLSSHSQASISRLINLASALSAAGEKSKAASTLMNILPFTNEQTMINARLRVFAELYLLQDEGSTKYWPELLTTANKIESSLSDTAKSYTAHSSNASEYVVDMLDNLALAYYFNNEPLKGLRILKIAVANHPTLGYSLSRMDAQLALFAAASGQYTLVPEYLRRALDPAHYIPTTTSSIIARLINTCSQNGKNDLAEKVAQQTIDACNQAIEHPALDAPQMKGETPEETAANKTYYLKVQLSAIRYKYGELLLKLGRYAEAEENLKQVEPSGNNFVDAQMGQVYADLYKALEAQKKYDEAQAIFSNLINIQGSRLPILNQLIDGIAGRPNLSVSDQTKVIECLRMAGSSEENSGSCARKLFALAQSRNWSEANIATLREFCESRDNADGKIDPVKTAQLKKAEDDEQEQKLTSAMVQLKLGNLEGLDPYRKHGNEQEYIGFTYLTSKGRFDDLEKALKLWQQTMETSPKSWDTQAMSARCAWLNYWVFRKDETKAKLAFADILKRLPQQNQSSSSRPDEFSRYWPVLRAVPQMLLANGHSEEAQKLALQLLALPKLWVGPMNGDHLYVYGLLQDIASARKLPKLEACYHKAAVDIGTWLCGPPETRNQRDVYPRELFPADYWNSREKYHAYDAEDFARRKYIFDRNLKQHGEGSEAFMDALNSLVDYYKHKHQFADAEQLLRRKLRIAQAIEGRHGPSQATYLKELASLESERHLH